MWQVFANGGEAGILVERAHQQHVVAIAQVAVAKAMLPSGAMVGHGEPVVATAVEGPVVDETPGHAMQAAHGIAHAALTRVGPRVVSVEEDGIGASHVAAQLRLAERHRHRLGGAHPHPTHPRATHGAHPQLECSVDGAGYALRIHTHLTLLATGTIPQTIADRRLHMLPLSQGPRQVVPSERCCSIVWESGRVPAMPSIGSIPEKQQRAPGSVQGARCVSYSLIPVSSLVCAVITLRTPRSS